MREGGAERFDGGHRVDRGNMRAYLESSDVRERRTPLLHFDTRPNRAADAGVATMIEGRDAHG